MKAYEVINSPEKWCREYCATTRDGRSCPIDCSAAVRFCAFGSIIRAYSDRYEKEDKIFILIRYLRGIPIGTWNDSKDWKIIYDTLKLLDI